MAQIIKHRRGSLESVSSATKRSGELLVVTGSAGITATNSNGLLFVGIDGSTVTAANKFLQGTSVPNLTGASYDTSIDGIPFYDTSAEKLYILNKAGNIEVKATANTGGTGIVSSSAQIDSLGFLQVNGDAVVSGSSQITISDTTGFSAFSSSLASKDAGLDSRIISLEAFSSSLGDGFATDAELTAVSQAFDTTIDGLTTNDIAEGSNLYFTDARVKTKLNAEGVISGSSQVNADSITNFDSNVKDKLNADGVISGSSQVNADSITNFDANVKAKNDADGVVSGSSQISADQTEGWAADVKTQLDSNTVISGSSQVQIDSVSGFTAFSSSVDGRLDVVEAAIGDGSSIDTRLDALEVFSGSQEAKDATLATYTASVDQDLTALHAYSASLKTAISVSGQNLTVIGNLEVQGTTTTVDSTTISLGDNIIELNGSGAVNGGLLVKDVTAPNQVSGSLLWDSTNDYWKAGALGSEQKILLQNGDGVVSGSAQITLTDAVNTGFNTSYVAEDASALYYTDARVKTKLNAEGVVSGSSQIQLSAVSGYISDIKSRLDAEGVISGSSQVNADSITNFDSNVLAYNNSLGVVSGSSQIQIASVTGFSAFSSSADSRLVTLEAAVGDGSNLDLRLDALESFSSSLDDSFATEAELNAATASLSASIATTIAALDTDDVAEATNLYYTDARVKTKMNADGVISGSSQLHAAFDVRYLNTDGDDVVSGSAQIVSLLSNQATDFGTGRVSADNFGDAAGTSTFTGSFVGDGSGLTGLATNLSISGDSGTDTVDLLNDTLSITGGTAISAAVTNNTITINASDASTSAKGIASFDADDFSVASGNVSIKAGGVRAANLNADVAGTGISLNGVDNSIEVDYGSTAGTAVEGNTSLTVQGTANEIEIAGGSVTLGAGGTVTIGLPDSVTIATASIQNDLSVGGNVEITGNLSVLGTTTTINSTTVELGDNIIELNGAGNANGGLLVKDITAPNTVSGSLLWDSTNDYWKGGALGSEKEFARFNADPTVNKIQKVDANGLLVDSVLTDDGTDATFSGDVIVDGFGSNANGAFLYADANNTLTAVAPANAGDLIQWNGSSFVASNEVDGGTF